MTDQLKRIFVVNIDSESRFEDIDTLMRTCFPIHEFNSVFLNVLSETVIDSESNTIS